MTLIVRNDCNTVKFSTQSPTTYKSQKTSSPTLKPIPSPTYEPTVSPSRTKTPKVKHKHSKRHNSTTEKANDNPIDKSHKKSKVEINCVLCNSLIIIE